VYNTKRAFCLALFLFFSLFPILFLENGKGTTTGGDTAGSLSDESESSVGLMGGYETNKADIVGSVGIISTIILLYQELNFNLLILCNLVLYPTWVGEFLEPDRI